MARRKSTPDAEEAARRQDAAEASREIGPRPELSIPPVGARVEAGPRSGAIRVDLTIPAATATGLDLFVNGGFAAHVSALWCETRDDFRREIDASHAARTACGLFHRAFADMKDEEENPDGLGTRPLERRASFARGLEDGLRGKTRPYPGAQVSPSSETIPAVLPEVGRSYERGWALGDAMRGAVRMARGDDATP